MRIGHDDSGGLEFLPDIAADVKARLNDALGGDPEPDRVGNGRISEALDLGQPFLALQRLAAGNGLLQGGEYVLRVAVVGGGDLRLDAALAQGSVVFQGRVHQLGIRDQNAAVVHRVHPGIDDADVVHGGLLAVHGDEVALAEGLAADQHHPARHVGKDALHRQGNGQRDHAQKGHEGAHVDAKIGGDDHEHQKVQHEADRRENEADRAALQPGFQHGPADQAHRDPHRCDSNHQQQNCGQQGRAPDAGKDRLQTVPVRDRGG